MKLCCEPFWLLTQVVTRLWGVKEEPKKGAFFMFICYSIGKKITGVGFSKTGFCIYALANMIFWPIRFVWTVLVYAALFVVLVVIAIIECIKFVAEEITPYDSGRVARKPRQ